MKRVLAIVMVVVMAGLMGQGAAPGGPAAPSEEAVGGAVRFVPVDVMIETGAVGLGSWQVEVKALEGVKVVGVEGGDAAAFQHAPFYDPQALMEGERIVMASFSTDAGLPSGKVRVARVHVTAPERVDDAALSKMTSKLVVATDGDGKSIAAKLSLQVYQGDKR